MNFLMKNTFRRLPIIVSDFVGSVLPMFPFPMLEHQLVGHSRPNYEENYNESPNSVFDDVILRMAAPKSKVKSQLTVSIYR